MNSSISHTSMMDYFRPRGKIICIGDTLKTELTIITKISESNTEYRVPILLLSSSEESSELVDQVVVFESNKTISQVHNLLNSYFLFFIFNSSEYGILGILGSILASIEYRGSIPIFIDTGPGISLDQRKLLGECYFNFPIIKEESKEQLSIFIETLVSVLTPTSSIGVSFSDLIQIFGNSKNVFHGISSSLDLESVMDEIINQIGENLVNTLPETLEELDTIFIIVISGNPLSLHSMNKITTKFSNTFGEEFTIHFSNSIDNKFEGYKTLAVLTDINLIQEIIPSTASFPEFNFDKDAIDPANELTFSFQERNSDTDNDEDFRFRILGQIFSESEVYIFDDGGLPLFSSHKPAGQEVCLYTGLFSAIQSMSSDLIGHSPDHLTAGDKRCVFITKKGPNEVQLRGVAICGEGSEDIARNDLKVSIDLVQGYMQQGEPDYAINDRIQGVLVQSYQKGELSNGLSITNYQAS
ncbi:MAG: hypothetical protein ACXACP_01655 [Candidatus Hodarchaeales archaeon]